MYVHDILAQETDFSKPHVAAYQGWAGATSSHHHLHSCLCAACVYTQDPLQHPSKHTGATHKARPSGTGTAHAFSYQEKAHLFLFQKTAISLQKMEGKMETTATTICENFLSLCQITRD